MSILVIAYDSGGTETIIVVLKLSKQRAKPLHSISFVRNSTPVFKFKFRSFEKNDTDAFKPVARHFNLPHHSHHNMTICRLSLQRGNTESRKNLEQKITFQLGTLSPHGMSESLGGGGGGSIPRKIG